MCPQLLTRMMMSHLCRLTRMLMMNLDVPKTAVGIFCMCACMHAWPVASRVLFLADRDSRTATCVLQDQGLGSLATCACANTCVSAEARRMHRLQTAVGGALIPSTQVMRTHPGRADRPTPECPVTAAAAASAGTTTRRFGTLSDTRVTTFLT